MTASEPALLARSHPACLIRGSASPCPLSSLCDDTVGRGDGIASTEGRLLSHLVAWFHARSPASEPSARSLASTRPGDPGRERDSSRIRLESELEDPDSGRVVRRRSHQRTCGMKVGEVGSRPTRRGLGPRRVTFHRRATPGQLRRRVMPRSNRGSLATVAGRRSPNDSISTAVPTSAASAGSQP